jgi:hypothetical protein
LILPLHQSVWPTRFILGDVFVAEYSNNRADKGATNKRGIHDFEMGHKSVAVFFSVVSVQPL